MGVVARFSRHLLYWDMDTIPSEQYLATQSRSVQRLVRALQYSGTQANDTFLSHLSHVAMLPYFEGKLQSFILQSILRARIPAFREACLGALLKARPDLAKPDEIAHAVMHNGRYELAPLLKAHGLIPPVVSANDQTGIVMALRDRWSYPDILCPNILMDPDNVRILAQTLFTRASFPRDAALLARIVALPMHKDARQLFTEFLVDQGASPLGAKRLYNGLSHADGAIGGLLLRHDLIDIPQLFEDLNQHPQVHEGIALCQAWILNQTTVHTPSEHKRPRL